LNALEVSGQAGVKLQHVLKMPADLRYEFFLSCSTANSPEGTTESLLTFVLRALVNSRVLVEIQMDVVRGC